jgi:ABC-type branched-subunit amino acid transport system permease subunit
MLSAAEHGQIVQLNRESAMRRILTWALIGCLAVGGLDLMVGFAAMLGLIHSGFYQIANLPALMIHPGGPSSVKDSLVTWVPQMAAIGFVGGAMLASVVALINRFRGR